jgi:hypothetical protein
LHSLRATRAATKLLRRLATPPLLRLRLLLLRTPLLLRATLLLRLPPLLRTQALLLRTQVLLLRTLAHRLRLLLRAQASKLRSHDAHRGLGPGGVGANRRAVWRQRQAYGGQAKKPRTFVRGFFVMQRACG